VQDLRDLQMWANLAWFAKEFRDGAVPLITGDVVSVERFVRQEHGYAVSDIEAMVAEQYKILRAIIPMHRALQERGQIEVSTSPYYHPILPLLIDSDRASLDRVGTTLPPRFAYPVDADAQIRLAVEAYDR
jgi:alpha-amylase/alpha-mannosidase (GH57 family)